MDTTVAIVKPPEQLFIEAERNWDLPKIYAEIESTKQKLFGEKQLTCLQKTILRGLLCNYTPKQIADRLEGEVDRIVINLTWKLHRCVQALTGIEAKAIESYQDISDWLEKAGYKTPVTPSKITKKQTKEQQFVKKEEIYPKNNFSNHRNPVFISKQNAVLYADSEPQPKSTPQNLKAVSLSADSHQNQSIIVPSEGTIVLVDADEFLPTISRWARLGGIFMVASVIITIAIAAFTPYNATVKAQAKIRPASGLKVVEAETEGTIVAIRVRENQVVKQGEIIAIVDNSRLETKKSQLENNIQQANLQLKQIEAQIIAQNYRIGAETNRTNRVIASAKSQLNLRHREYQDRTITTNAQVTEAQANLRLTQEELYQAQTELASAQASLKSAEAALKSAISKGNRYQKIAESGALSQNQLEEAQLEVEQRKQDVVVQQTAIDRQKREIARRRQAIAAAMAKLKSVRTTLNPSNAEVAIAKEHIAQERASGQATIASLKREKEALIQQVIEIENQLKRHRSELKQLEKDLQQTIIKASVEGTLFQLRLKNPGQVVLPGEEIARIAPSSTALSIQALVPAQKIANVAIGQPAQAKISACPYPDYGTLKGMVSKIAPDTSISRDNNPNGARNASQVLVTNFYEVRIVPESLVVKRRNKQCVLQLGMEGVADIVTQEETVLKFMLRKARLLVDL